MEFLQFGMLCLALNERESIDILLSYFSVKYKVNKRKEEKNVDDDDCNDNK